MLKLGIDVGGTTTKFGVYENGQQKKGYSCATPKSRSGLLELLIEESTRLSTEFNLDSVGIGWPGPVHQGFCLYTPNLPEFQGFPLLTALQEKISLPLYLENDAKCAGLAERYFGAGIDLQDFIVLTFGTGLGGAVFNQGQLLRGRNNAAGELGHLILHSDGISCLCGQKGCLEKYISASALERRYQEISSENLSAREILFLSRRDDKAREVLFGYVKDLSLGLQSIEKAFNPEAVILGGGLFSTGAPEILELLNQFPHLPPLRLSQIVDRAGTLGASCL